MSDIIQTTLSIPFGKVPLQLIGDFKVKPEFLEEIKVLTDELLKQSRTEPGNISYDAFVSLTEPNRLAFLEQWVDNEALANHFTKSYFIDYMARVSDWL